MLAGQLFQMEKDEELRVEVEGGQQVVVELKEGTAEVFGTEMVEKLEYKFKAGSKFSVFTYHGCKVLVKGETEAKPYTSKETPMIQYLNVHASLEQSRKEAAAAAAALKEGEAQSEDKPDRGPIVLVVGPTDVGKSTLCRILLNYAVRMGRRPIYVDLDVGQNALSVPGTISAVLVERPAAVDGHFAQTAPLIYHYGHKSPAENGKLYSKLVSRMADVVRERMGANRKIGSSGAVINTCGWVRDEGYSHIKHVAEAFEVDVILVLDNERVYNDLIRDMPTFVKNVWLPKSGGVVDRNREQRASARDAKMKEYFYGPDNNLFPHSFEVWMKGGFIIVSYLLLPR